MPLGALGRGADIFEQVGNCHWTDATGHRTDRASHFARGVEIDVTGESSVSTSIDSDVDDARAGFEPIAAYETVATDRGNDDVGAANVRGEIPRAAVAHGHRRMSGEQQHRDGLADNVAASDDDRVEALRHDTRSGDQPHAASGRTRHEAGLAGY